MRILFLCVANSARSQMAEGLARNLYGSRAFIASAGSSPTTVNPLAVQAMSNIGIDLTNHRSKGIEDWDLLSFDVIITLCADEICPLVPQSVRTLHWPFEDPAVATGSTADRLAAFEKIRDQIKESLIFFGRNQALI